MTLCRSLIRSTGFVVVIGYLFVHIRRSPKLVRSNVATVARRWFTARAITSLLSRRAIARRLNFSGLRQGFIMSPSLPQFHPLRLKERKISVVGIPMNIPVDQLGHYLRAWLVSTDAESGTVEIKMVVDNKMWDIRTVRF